MMFLILLCNKGWPWTTHRAPLDQTNGPFLISYGPVQSPVFWGDVIPSHLNEQPNKLNLG